MYRGSSAVRSVPADTEFAAMFGTELGKGEAGGNYEDSESLGRATVVDEAL